MPCRGGPALAHLLPNTILHHHDWGAESPAKAQLLGQYGWFYAEGYLSCVVLTAAVSRMAGESLSPARHDIAVSLEVVSPVQTVTHFGGINGSNVGYVRDITFL